MKVKSFVAAAGLSLAAASSHAGVVYEWVIVNDHAPQRVAMRLEFKESTIAKGSFGLDYDASTGQALPDSGLISFSFGNLFHATPGTTFPYELGYLRMSLGFTQNNFYLTGSINALDLHTRLNASTGFSPNQDERLFTFYNTDSDGLPYCYWEPNRSCSGATGYFRQVPEPGSLAILGLGALGVFLARRRKPTR